ncbi:hypothetical protein M5D96_005690, partial [Drosophila gunungcola]
VWRCGCWRFSLATCARFARVFTSRFGGVCEINLFNKYNIFNCTNLRILTSRLGHLLDVGARIFARSEVFNIYLNLRRIVRIGKLKLYDGKQIVSEQRSN